MKKTANVSVKKRVTQGVKLPKTKLPVLHISQKLKDWSAKLRPVPVNPLDKKKLSVSPGTNQKTINADIIIIAELREGSSFRKELVTNLSEIAKLVVEQFNSNAVVRIVSGFEELKRLVSVCTGKILLFSNFPPNRAKENRNNIPIPYLKEEYGISSFHYRKILEIRNDIYLNIITEASSYYLNIIDLYLLGATKETNIKRKEDPIFNNDFEEEYRYFVREKTEEFLSKLEKNYINNS